MVCAGWRTAHAGRGRTIATRCGRGRLPARYGQQFLRLEPDGQPGHSDHRAGSAALVVNTRGHDGISSTNAPVGRRLQGAAYEIVDACCHDVAAWLAWLRERGYRRLGLLGHSLGAVKAIYSQAHRADDRLPGSWRFRRRDCRSRLLSMIRVARNSCAITGLPARWSSRGGRGN